jgi:hypothetical protein
MRRLATVPPSSFGSAEWIADRAPLLELAAKRVPNGTAEQVAQWADEFLWEHADVADLRALGFCAKCGREITLRQVGRCVYSEPCGHYRAQGELARIQAYLTRSLAAMSAERRAAVLRLVGRS